MKVLKTIRDKDLGLDSPDSPTYEERKAARAIVFDKNSNIALLHATKKKYYKLPGGGIEGNETVEEGLRREVMEEIGCKISNLKELGIIEEYRNNIPLHQISYCFTANLVEQGSPNLTSKEENDGFKAIWVSIEEAIERLNTDDTA